MTAGSQAPPLGTLEYKQAGTILVVRVSDPHPVAFYDVALGGPTFTTGIPTTGTGTGPNFLAIHVGATGCNTATRLSDPPPGCKSATLKFSRPGEF